MSTIKNGSLVVLALATLASAASAQARPAAPRQPAQRQAPAAPAEGFWELGTDVGLDIGIDDPKTFSINIPTGILRAGYYVTPVLSLEPALTFQSFAQEDETAASAWLLQLGGLYHFSENRRENQWFVHPSIGFTGGSEGVPNFVFLSAFGGLKMPYLNGRMVGRLEAGLRHRLKEDPFDSATEIVFTAGWSIYTR